MPPKTSLQPPEQEPRHDTKIPFLLIFVSLIFVDLIRKDMGFPHFDNLETIVIHQFPDLPEGITISNGTAFLSFRILPDKLLGSPESALAILHDYPENLP